MADEPAKTNAPAPRKKRLPLTLGIVVGIAALQGVGFFLFFKFAGSKPAAAHGEASHAIEPPPATTQPAQVTEVQLLKGFRVPNNKTGRTWVYELDVSAVVPAGQKEKAQKLAEERAGEIADRIAGLVRGAAETTLREDDLRVLRGQFLEGLKEIIGDDKLIQRVLIPRFVPIRAE